MPAIPIQTVSTKHEAIINFMLANPTMRLQDVAAHHGVSGPWLSVLIHSDAFQARLKAKSEVLFGLTVRPLAEKINAVAHRAVDRLLEKVDDPNITPRTALDILELTTARIDFAGKAQEKASTPPGPQMNIFAVSAELLAETRSRILEGQFTRRPESAVEALDAPAADTSPAERLPPGTGD